MKLRIRIFLGGTGILKNAFVASMMDTNFERFRCTNMVLRGMAAQTGVWPEAFKRRASSNRLNFPELFLDTSMAFNSGD